MTLAGINNLKFAGQPQFGYELGAPYPANGGVKSQPLYLRGATEAKEREEEKLQLTPALDADTFTKTVAGEGEGDATASPLAAGVKNALKEGGFMARKGTAAFLIKCATGIDYTQHKLLSASQPEATQQEELQQTADQIKNLSNEEKVRLVGDVTGGDSIYTRYAKNRLIGESGLALKDTIELFRPHVAEKTLSGYKEAFSAIGTGLLTLAVAGVGGPLFSPDGLGKIIAAVGITLA